ncbi:PREDICTED: tetraspanin-14 [Gekko japonicus]|uniref:Tetraspanin-14 n=1 Tax=Gekko japonicus TaxID=146911 RepID=A0ABM1KGU8_GEKJA|nr:PREDICTED: tetraspanin-14 [Gekko japonicus]
MEVGYLMKSASEFENLHIVLGQLLVQIPALQLQYNILAGVAFLGVGLWAWSEKGILSDISQMTRLNGFDPVVLVLLVGGVMFILGFAGCIGALRENICLLRFFCGTIVLIFILELVVAVLAFLFQDWVRDQVETFFKNNIKSYRDDIDLQNLIDSLQKIIFGIFLARTLISDIEVVKAGYHF